jgi:hypothetical protein
MKGHRPVYRFTKILKGKKIDVFTCPCGVIGYRAAGTEDPPIRDPKRFAREHHWGTCELAAEHLRKLALFDAKE